MVKQKKRKVKRRIDEFCVFSVVFFCCHVCFLLPFFAYSLLFYVHFLWHFCFHMCTFCCCNYFDSALSVVINVLVHPIILQFWKKGKDYKSKNGQITEKYWEWQQIQQQKGLMYGMGKYLGCNYFRCNLDQMSGWKPESQRCQSEPITFVGE